MEIRRTIIVCVTLFALMAGVSGQTADTLKIMTYNLRFGELAPMEQIGQFIASQNPDIVALQECDWATYRERAPHQNGVKFINVLAAESGMFGIYGKSIDYKGGYYGIGILSRYPIIKSERVLLPNDGKTEQRSMLVADIELPGGKMLTFVCTHLEVSSSELRVAQARFIDAWLEENGRDGMVFLAGDMNALPESEEMTYLREGWTDLTDREFTFHTSNPSTKIDYIYGRPAGRLELLYTGLCTDTKLSDHFPVVSSVICF